MGDKMAEVRKKEKVEKYNVEKELAKSKKKDSQAKKNLRMSFLKFFP